MDVIIIFLMFFGVINIISAIALKSTSSEESFKNFDFLEVENQKGVKFVLTPIYSDLEVSKWVILY